MKNFIKGVIISLIFIFIFYGCSSSGMIHCPEPSETAKDGSFIYRRGTFEFGDKEYQTDYGTITVPENRDNPQSKLIHLPVIRIHALIEKNTEPVFGLAGGPGQSNFKFRPIDSLLFNHDCVIVGYRGVEGSTILDFPEVEEAMKGSGDNLLSEESLKKIGHAWKISFHHLEQEGVDWNGYTIPETVEDLEAVRKIFKYNRINLISESYGTRVAYTYGIMHPESIHRSVMIGVGCPGGFIWNPERTDEQIRHYSSLWAKDPALAKKCSDLSTTMRNVLNNIPGKWLLFSIDPGKVKAVTFGMLFHRKEAALVFDTYAAAENGDYSGLALMSMAYNYTIPDMFVWGDFAVKAISADQRYWEEKADENNNTNTILGSPFNELFWKTFKYGDFKVKSIPDSLCVPKKSDVETLLISGNVDFANPPGMAQELLTYLKKGKLVIMSEAGHVGDLRYLQLDATKGLIADFINEGVVDTSKIKYMPMNFDAGMGFPGIAKTGTALVGTLLLLLTAGILWWIL